MGSAEWCAEAFHMRGSEQHVSWLLWVGTRLMVVVKDARKFWWSRIVGDLDWAR